VHKKFYKRNCE